VESREARSYRRKKKQLADDVIINDDHQLVIPQVLALHQRYLALLRNKNQESRVRIKKIAKCRKFKTCLPISIKINALAFGLCI